MGFANNLNFILRSLDINQSALASKLGVSRGIVSEFASGAREPSKEFLFGLSKLGVSIDWFLTGEGTPFLKEGIGASAGLAPPGTKGIGAAGPILASHTGKVPVYTPAEITDENDAPLAVGSKFDTEISLFKFSHGKPKAIPTNDADPDALVMLPIYSQRASAGPGQLPTQLAEIEAYMPIIYELLGGAHPRNCGVVRVVGDSMTDMTLFSGDLVVFDRTQIEGNGVYVISIMGEVRVKRIEYRIFEKKIIIRSENQKRYPDPEIISYEQAQEMLMIHGKVISWVHRHPY